MENKAVLISNLEVLTEELKKLEQGLDNDYAKTLTSTSQADITKEEFYMENAMCMLMDAIESLEMLVHLLNTKTPENLIEIAKDSGKDYRDISVEMKKRLIQYKLEQNPLLGMMATIDAIMKMTNKSKK